LAPRLAAALVVIALTLVLCTTASGAILFSTIARGETTFYLPDRPRQAVFLARSPGAATAFTHLLFPAEREAVQYIDWREYVVLAAIVYVPRACDPADITLVSRKRTTTLVVTVVVTRQAIGCPAVVGWRYHVVKLRRAALRPFPRRVVLNIVRWP
jgi:hypothetical protein